MRRISMLAAALAAALMITPVAFASPTGHAAGYKGSGKTSQNGRILLNLSSSGKSVTVNTVFKVSCDSGATYTDTGKVNGPAHPGGFVGHHLSRVKFDFTNSESGNINTA